MCITLPFVYLLYEARKASYSLAPYSFFKKSVSSKRRSGKSGRSIFTGPFALQITLNLVLPPPSGRRLFLNEKILATFFSPYGGTKEVPSLNINPFSLQRSTFLHKIRLQLYAAHKLLSCYCDNQPRHIPSIFRY